MNSNFNYPLKEEGDQGNLPPKQDPLLFDYSSLSLSSSFPRTQSFPNDYHNDDNYMNHNGNTPNYYYPPQDHQNSAMTQGSSRSKKRKIKSLGSSDHPGSHENLVYLDTTTAAGILPSYPLTSNGMAGNAVYSANSQLMKRRFVWPQTLHQDFIGAVFDIGLRYANPRDVLAFMNGSSGGGGGSSGGGGMSGLNQDLLKSQILKYQLFRDQRFFPRAYFYDLENSSYNDQLLYTSTPSSTTAITPHTDDNQNKGYEPSSSSSQKERSNRSQDVSNNSGGGNKEQQQAMNHDQLKLIDKLEKECKELMKNMNNSFIKIEFLMKLENDMTQEMNDLINKQNQRRQLIGQQLTNLFHQNNDNLPTSHAFTLLADSIRDHLPSLTSSNNNSNSNHNNHHSNNNTHDIVSSSGQSFNNSNSSNLMNNNQSIHKSKSNGEDDSSMAEILAAKYRSIMEMKDHIKLHRVLLQKHDSQIHGHNGSPESLGVSNTASAFQQSQPPASVDFEFPAANNDVNHALQQYGGNPNPSSFNEASSNLLNQPVSESDFMSSKWFDENEEDLFSFLLE